MIKDLENLSFQPENFKGSLNSILSRQLTPETIDTYAVDALDELIELAERVTGAYASHPTIEALNKTETEDVAFNYFSLGELESSLDHVADLAESINSIENVIKSATVIDEIITPPDYSEHNIQAGNGNFDKKNTYNRLKTILFILQEDFGVDLHDSERLQLTTGGTKGVMRDASYNLIEIPELNRAVLAYDEEGNATYVFDTAALTNIEISPDNLMRLSKSQLNQLVGEAYGAGRRLVYSASFIANIKACFGDELTSDSGTSDRLTAAENIMYLKKVESAPEGYLSAKSMEVEFGISYHVIADAIGELGSELGDTIQAKFYSRITAAFSPEQQAMIHNYLSVNGTLTEQAPDGYLSIHGMAAMFGVTHKVIKRLVATYKGELGDTIQARFGSSKTAAYSPEQQKMIRAYLNGEE